MAVGDRTKALECFEQALGIFDTLSHRQGRANALVNLAEGMCIRIERGYMIEDKNCVMVCIIMVNEVVAQ
jgi:hypothetical protein